MQSSVRETPTPALISLQLMGFHKFKTIMETKEMYVYDKIEGIYKNQAELLIRSLMRTDYPNHKTNDANEVIRDIQDRSFIRRVDFDNHKKRDTIPLKNYLVSTRDLSHDPFSPEYFYTYKYPSSFIKNARCPKFIKFLKQILPNGPVDIIRVLEGFASGLVPEMKLEKAYMFVGTKAQNGKSTLFNIMASVLGQVNIANVSIHDLKYNRFAKSNLVDKSYNIFADVDSKALRELGIIKMIISGDSMNIERKGQDAFDYSPRCRLFFSSNQPPIIDEDSNAVYRRFVLIEFPVEFRKHDPFFERKFEDEYDGIMSLLLRHANFLYHTKKLRYEQTPEDLRVVWDLKSNPIAKFIDDMLVRKEGARLEHGEIYNSYVLYCRRNHFTVEPMNMFTRLMKKKGNQQLKSNNKTFWVEWELKEIPKEQEKIVEDE